MNWLGDVNPCSSQQTGSERREPFPRPTVHVRRTRIRANQRAGTRYGGASIGEGYRFLTPPRRNRNESAKSARAAPLAISIAGAEPICVINHSAASPPSGEPSENATKKRKT